METLKKCQLLYETHLPHIMRPFVDFLQFISEGPIKIIGLAFFFCCFFCQFIKILVYIIIRLKDLF